ncbi:hypothetical protein HEMROJRC1_20410 [Rodentibacter sp. JRC1]|uniref:type II toxin-antitoxin system YafQ family toxin n=1 Tax=Rodentibacter sp. JRC1 TaxID=2874504 RepID=UPI001CFCBC5A|nr:type II toxin-antitoxin system YafQ family toxin [Rodentibacter sp. JRC1]GJI56929.1 hypothetical protein HEMROJRC1_20410 [Rodentibacter sp. JRC1]
MNADNQLTFQVSITTLFKKDIKKLEAKQLCSPEFNEVMYLLQHNKPLPKKYLDHPLEGKMKEYRDCHIFNDLVLIYKIDRDKKELQLIRIGSHSALFK